MSGDLSCNLWVPRTLLWDSLSKNDLFSSLLSVCSSVALMPCLSQLGFLSRHLQLDCECGCLYWTIFLVSFFSFFFVFFCFFSLMPFSSLLVPLPFIPSKSLPLCFAFSPLGDVISGDCYHLISIVFLVCVSAVLQSCCFPADQHSQLGYLNAALLALCWIC